MTAQRQDFEMNEGETKVIVVDGTTDEDNGGTLDISGRQELKWVLKEEKFADTNVVSKTESGSADVTVTDESVGAYEIQINPSDTQGLDELQVKRAHNYYHTVRLTDGSGNVSDLLEGRVHVDAA